MILLYENSALHFQPPLSRLLNDALFYHRVVYGQDDLKIDSDAQSSPGSLAPLSWLMSHEEALITLTPLLSAYFTVYAVPPVGRVQ